MKLTVVLLFLMGLRCVITCELYEYHYINTKMNWADAQAYCKKKYTDLATVTNMTDMRRLIDVIENEDNAWIGLYKDIERRWLWSLPGLEFNGTEIKWGRDEPNDKEKPENCGFMRLYETGTLGMGDVSCEKSEGVFLCYDETTKKTHLIRHKWNWLKAQRYCRHNHTDLASGPDLVNSPLNEIDEKNFMLIGLFRDTWRWSDDSSFSFRNWHEDFDMRDTGQSLCAMVDKNNKDWMSDNCNKPKHFICYDDKVILVKENKTWVEALEFCREKHYELVSITDLNQQRWIQDRAKQADTDFVWLGLRYTCTLDFWFWITDEVVGYKNWAENEPRDDCDMSGAMDTRGKHEWFRKSDEEKFNFICFKD